MSKPTGRKGGHLKVVPKEKFKTVREGYRYMLMGTAWPDEESECVPRVSDRDIALEAIGWRYIPVNNNTELGWVKFNLDFDAVIASEGDETWDDDLQEIEGK